MEKRSTEGTVNTFQDHLTGEKSLSYRKRFSLGWEHTKKKDCTTVLNPTKNKTWFIGKKMRKSKNIQQENVSTQNSLIKINEDNVSRSNKKSNEKLRKPATVVKAPSAISQTTKDDLIEEETELKDSLKLLPMATYYAGRLKILIRKLAYENNLVNTFELASDILSRMIKTIQREPQSFIRDFILSNGMDLVMEVLKFIKKYIHESHLIITLSLFEDGASKLLKSVQLMTDNKEGFEYFNKSRKSLILIANLASYQNLTITQFVFEILTKFCDSDYYTELIPYVFKFYYEESNQPMPHFRLICILQKAINESKTTVIEAAIDFINTIANFYAFNLSTSTEEMHKNVAMGTYLNLQLISAGFLNICEQICRMKDFQCKKKIKYHYYKMLKFERALIGHALTSKEKCDEFNSVIFHVISSVLCKTTFKDFLHFSNIYGDGPPENKHEHYWPERQLFGEDCHVMNVLELIFAARGSLDLYNIKEFGEELHSYLKAFKQQKPSETKSHRTTVSEYIPNNSTMPQIDEVPKQDNIIDDIFEPHNSAHSRASQSSDTIGQSLKRNSTTEALSNKASLKGSISSKSKRNNISPEDDDLNTTPPEVPSVNSCLIAPLVTPLAPPPPPPLFLFRGKNESRRLPDSKHNYRRINLDSLNDKKIKSSLWSKVSDTEIFKKINIDDLSTHFALKTFPETKRLMHEKSYNLSLGSIPIVEHKVAEGIFIILRTTKKSIGEFADSIKNMSYSYPVTENHIKQIITFYEKSLSEVKHLQSMSKLDIQNDADRFILELSKIPLVLQRLKMMLCKVTSREILKEVQNSITMYTAACKEILNSKSMEIVLGLILTISNYINKGPSSSARGISLESLSKLVDYKSSLEASQNLLTYIMKLAKVNFPEAYNIDNEVTSLNACDALFYDDITLSQTLLKKEIKEFTVSKSAMEEDKVFKQHYIHFVEPLEKKLSQLANKTIKLNKMVTQCMTMFGEDVKKTSTIEYFKHMSSFMNNIKNCKRYIDEKDKITRIEFVKSFEQSSINQTDPDSTAVQGI